MVRIYIYIISAVLMVLLSGCDTERFTSYKQEARQLAKTTHIQGKIVDTFTQKPVWGAVFQAREQQTVSNRLGLFEMNLVLSEDDEYSRPMDIYIYANKFYPGSHQRVIMPLINHLRFTLDRAAPVIDTTILIEIEDLTQDTLKHYLCQTIITDYQGASTVSDVSGIFSYAAGGRPAWFSHGMTMVKTVSNIKSCWQTFFSLDSQLRMLYSYKIRAADNEGYYDILDHINWELDNQLLFSTD